MPYASVSIASAELVFTALSSGQWANGQLLVDVDVQGLDLSTAGDPLAFNLTIRNLTDGTSEYFPAVTMSSSAHNFVTAVINDADNGSQLVNVAATAYAAGIACRTRDDGHPGHAVEYHRGRRSECAVGRRNHCHVRQQGLQPDADPAQWSGNRADHQDYRQKCKHSPDCFRSGFAAANGIEQLAPGQRARGFGEMHGRSQRHWNPGNPGKLSTAESTGRHSFLRQPGPALNNNDAATALGLIAPTSSNVAHYALGSSSTTLPAGITPTPATAPSGLPQTEQLKGDSLALTGIYALTKVDLFNLLSIPEAARAQAGNPSAADPNINAVEIYSAAITLCDQRRAMLLIDPPPNVNTVAGAVDWKSNTIGVVDANGAAFFPRLRLADPLNNSQLRTFAPSGVVAGVYASTDASRGVWKAPAAIAATLNGVQNMTYQLSDAENGVLNPLGLNCFRTFPLYGPVLWGARTLVGADALTNQWKYVPVRRTALFIEESLYRGTKWVVFEPNDEPLWAAIRLNVGSFMDSLFKKGAFQGMTADQAYFVKCDNETTTQDDIDLGIVNILVGFAPLKPAEFVVIQIEQLTAQAGS